MGARARDRPPHQCGQDARAPSAPGRGVRCGCPPPHPYGQDARAPGSLTTYSPPPSHPPPATTDIRLPHPRTVMLSGVKRSRSISRPQRRSPEMLRRPPRLTAVEGRTPQHDKSRRRWPTPVHPPPATTDIRRPHPRTVMLSGVNRSRSISRPLRRSHEMLRRPPRLPALEGRTPQHDSGLRGWPIRIHRLSRCRSTPPPTSVFPAEAGTQGGGGRPATSPTPATPPYQPSPSRSICGDQAPAVSSPFTIQHSQFTIQNSHSLTPRPLTLS